jgi:hypothetical protein
MQWILLVLLCPLFLLPCQGAEKFYHVLISDAFLQAGIMLNCQSVLTLSSAVLAALNSPVLSLLISMMG